MRDSAAVILESEPQFSLCTAKAEVQGVVNSRFPRGRSVRASSSGKPLVPKIRL